MFRSESVLNVSGRRFFRISVKALPVIYLLKALELKLVKVSRSPECTPPYFVHYFLPYKAPYRHRLEAVWRFCAEAPSFELHQCLS